VLIDVLNRSTPSVHLWSVINRIKTFVQLRHRDPIYNYQITGRSYRRRSSRKELLARSCAYVAETMVETLLEKQHGLKSIGVVDACGSAF
jgi:hypothetical protein